MVNFQHELSIFAVKRMSYVELLLTRTRKDRRRRCSQPFRFFDYIRKCCKCLDSNSSCTLDRKAFACRQEVRCCTSKCCIHRWRMIRGRLHSHPWDKQLQQRSLTPTKQPTTQNTSSLSFARIPTVNTTRLAKVLRMSF